MTTFQPKMYSIGSLSPEEKNYLQKILKKKIFLSQTLIFFIVIAFYWVIIIILCEFCFITICLLW